MVRRSANSDTGETIRLDRGDWHKLLGVAVSGIVAIAGAAWSIAGTIREASVVYERRMTKAETEIDVLQRDSETHGRQIDEVKGQLRGRVTP